MSVQSRATYCMCLKQVKGPKARLISLIARATDRASVCHIKGYMLDLSLSYKELNQLHILDRPKSSLSRITGCPIRTMSVQLMVGQISLSVIGSSQPVIFVKTLIGPALTAFTSLYDRHGYNREDLMTEPNVTETYKVMFYLTLGISFIKTY